MGSHAGECASAPEFNYETMRVFSTGLPLENWETAAKLISGKNFANLATLMPDGSPQVTPVWVDLEGELILVNTAEKRTKLRNVKRDPRVAISIFEQDNPYSKVMILGRVKEITKQGAEDHIDKMALKYRGLPRYPWRQPGISRVLLKIRPTKITV